MQSPSKEHLPRAHPLKMTFSRSSKFSYIDANSLLVDNNNNNNNNNARVVWKYEQMSRNANNKTHLRCNSQTRLPGLPRGVVCEITFSRFDRTPACDKRTDKHTTIARTGLTYRCNTHTQRIYIHA